MLRRGFTLIEVMMVVVVAAILFIAAMPDSDAADTQRGQNFAMQLESDVAYAQSMSISNPVDPIVLRVDPVSNTYWLARQSDTSTPIVNERTGDAHLVTAGDDAYAGVDIIGVDFNGDSALGFDSVGVPDQDVPALVQIQSGSSKFEVAIAPTTGITSTRTTLTKVLPANAVAAATGVTRAIGEDSAVVERETGLANAADATDKSAMPDSVADLLNEVLGK
ncbi:MAG: prepilin-type N-terminal cleavage/methylation domain-containing protein [Phycisphaerales bacterium]|nr:prepilin-type N-terminal cleavage/methylation domain-containing protein [Phycisphaerales bacterium]